MVDAGPVLDLADPRFWSLLAVAVAVLVPLGHAMARQWFFATFSVAAIGLLFGPGTLAVATGIAVATYVAGQALAGARLRSGATPTALLIATFAGALILFVAHKLPHQTAAFAPLAALPPSLMAIGFSYVCLRMIDLLRVVAEGRAPAPGLAGSIGYLLPLHMLAAGPIQSYEAHARQPPVPPTLSMLEVLEALERIVGGLFKSYVLAGGLRTLLLTGFEAEGLYFLLEIQLFYLWVYLDFSAYSDIAVGLGRLLGIATPANFDRPLGARNLTVFWERWHISLSQFIRRNIFIPVQLTLARRAPRHPLRAASIAFLVAFLLCGLWHAFSLHFLIWGALHSFGLIVCNLYRHALTQRLGRDGLKRYQANRPIRWLATAITFEFSAVTLAFALDRNFTDRLVEWLG